MNVLHRRKQQLEEWETSVTNKEKLVERPPERVNFSDPVKFWAACSNRDIPEIERLLDLGVNVNVAKVDGLTALHQACIDNAYDIVKFLLDHGADSNIQDNEGWTPLHATSSCDFSEIARLLIERGASTGITSNDNELPIDITTNNQMRNILVEAMKKQGIEESTARNYEHDCLLEDSKRWLAKPDAYPKVTDVKTGASPIHVASAKDYVDILKILIQIPSIDVNIQDIDGWTPLHAAAHWGKEESARLLVGAGASFDICTFANQSVMDVSDPSLTMILKQLREQRRLYNLTVGQKENYPESKNVSHAVKRKSTSEDSDVDVSDTIKNQNGTKDPTSDKKAPKVDDLETISKDAVNSQKLTDQANKDESSKAVPIDDKTNSLDTKEKSKSLDDEKKALEKARDDIVLRSKTRQMEDEETNDKLLKDISNVRGKDKSLSSASSTSSSSSSSSYNRRVSAVMAPTKAEETETQRSIRARHVRSTRRSTQGISNETLEEARRLNETWDTLKAEADSSTNPNTNDSSKTPTTTPTTLASAGQKEDPPKVSSVGGRTSSSDGLPEKDTPPIRPWRERMNMNASASADSTTDSASTASSNSGNSSTNKISLRRQARERVPTGKVNQADLDAANEQLRESNSSLTNTSRQSSSDDPSTPTSVRPQTTRYTSRYTALNGTSSTTSAGNSTSGQSATSNSTTSYGSKGSENRTVSALTNSTGYSSVRNSPSRSGTFSALTSSNTPPPQSSWRESTNVDYRRLYEEERSEKDRLKRQLESLNRQITELHSELNRLQIQNNSSISDSKSTRRSNQNDEQTKELNTLREQNARMKEENGALIRVISKLSRPG